jgi:hypothetical protein
MVWGKKEGDPDRRLLQECPVCANVLRVKVLQCPACHTRIEGTFEPPRSGIFHLSLREIEFIELFIRMRGNIREVEKALGVSYPTVRGMLDRVIQAMGYTVRTGGDKRRRMEIITRLERGEITTEQATDLLESLEQGEESNGVE